MKQKARGLWLALGLVYVLGCAALPGPEQPELSGPYAVLEFPASMRLLALNDQQIDTLSRLSRLRVRPGQHILRFIHVNDGIDGSADHAGQLATPFSLEVYAGLTYHFESKTWGIIWRPAVAEQTPIAGYCVTHNCEAVAAHILQQQLQTAGCNWTLRR